MGAAPASLYFDAHFMRYRIMRYFPETLIDISRFIFIAHHGGNYSPCLPSFTLITNLNLSVVDQDSELESQGLATGSNYQVGAGQDVLGSPDQRTAQMPGQFLPQDINDKGVEAQSASSLSSEKRVKRPANPWILYRRDQAKQPTMAGKTAGEICT